MSKSKNELIKKIFQDAGLKNQMIQLARLQQPGELKMLEQAGINVAGIDVEAMIEMGYNQAVGKLAELLAPHFSAKEIETIAELYAHPTMRKFNDMAPEIIAAYQEQLQRDAQINVERLYPATPADEERNEGEGTQEPPPPIN